MESTGWGIWLIGAVLAFNLACLPLWFLVRHLQRNHDLYLQECQLFLQLLLADLGKAAEADSQLGESVRALEQQLAEAEALGPLWGRRPLALARLSVAQLQHLRPEAAERVWAQMTPESR